MRIVYILLLITNISFSQTTTNANLIIHEKMDLDRIDSIAKTLGYKGGEEIRVIAKFKITRDGYLTNLSIEGKDEFFKTEAERLIMLTPKYIPATKNGNPITVNYTLPILFKIETEKQISKRHKKEQKRI